MSNRKYYGYSITEAELAAVRRICVLCWGLLGDVFMRVTTIEALKRRFPDAELVVVTDPGSAKVFNNHPDVAEIITFSRKKKPAWKYLVSLIRHVRYLRTKHFDLCVDLYAGDSSARISRWAGARIRLGYDHQPTLRKCNNLLVKVPTFCGYWVRELAGMLAPLGVNPDSVSPGTRYHVSEAARQAAQPYLNAFPERKVIYNLGAGGPEKIWPLARMLALARSMNEHYGAVPVLLTSPGHEADTAAFIIEYQRYSQSYIHVPRVDFDIEAAVLEGVDLIVTPDSGLKHLAAAVRTPIAGLYLATRPEHTAPPNVPFVACMIERAGTVDDCGYPLLQNDLPVGVVLKKISDFVETALAWSPLEKTDLYKGAV